MMCGSHPIRQHPCWTNHPFPVNGSLQPSMPGMNIVNMTARCIERACTWQNLGLPPGWQRPGTSLLHRTPVGNTCTARITVSASNLRSRRKKRLQELGYGEHQVPVRNGPEHMPAKPLAELHGPFLMARGAEVAALTGVDQQSWSQRQGRFVSMISRPGDTRWRVPPGVRVSGVKLILDRSRVLGRDTNP